MVVVVSRRLFPFSFQFFSRLAAVFAEEVGSVVVKSSNHPIQCCVVITAQRVYFRPRFQ